MTESKWIKDSAGKEYPIRFNMTVFYELGKEYNIQANNIMKFISSMPSWELDKLYKLYLYALKSGARACNKEFDLEELAFVDWLFDDPSLLDQINRAFGEAMSSGGEAKEAKKKPMKKV